MTTVKAPVVVALVAFAAAACSAPATTRPTAPPAATACISTMDTGPEVPLTAPPTATAFTSSPVAMPSYMRTGGDTITGRQAVLEFPLPAQLAEPARVVVLAEFSVSTTDPGGWRLSRSFEAVAFWTADGAHASEQACPDQNPGVLAAMRAAGHDPLPERIEPGRSATGWVAFDLPRQATAIDLWCRHLDDDGGFAGAEAPLLRIPGS